MNIAIHDADKEHLRKKSFPNYALMKISAYHKMQGDTVELWNPLLTSTYDRIYSSKIFDFQADNIYLPESTIRGGTGYKDVPINQSLPEDIENVYPDYSLYPDCDYAIGYLTRGCPSSCPWCIVSQKEGDIKPYRTWQEVIRQDTNKLVLMDNNILASEHGLEQLKQITETKLKIDINQGMDARLITPEIAEILSRLKWIRFMRFGCDSEAQLEPLSKAIKTLNKYGVKNYKIFVYTLITKDLQEASRRIEYLKKIKGISLYAQAERNSRLNIIPNKGQIEFATRFIYGRAYLSETWDEYCCKRKFPYQR